MSPELTSRERFRRLLARKPVDRLPYDYWAVPEVDAKLCQHFGVSDKAALLDLFDVDFRYLEGPEYVGPPLREHGDGSVDDVWGVPRKVQVTGSGDSRGQYKYVTRHPLGGARTAADVEAYDHWPSPDWFDYSAVYDQARALREGGRVRVFMGDRLNRVAQLKPAMYLRGVDRALADLGRGGEVWHAINERVAGFYREYLRRILQAARGEVDLVFTGDDFGTQNGPMFRRSVFRERLFPNFAKFVEISHRAGVPVAHHTCGSIYALMPEFVNAELDVLNPLQPLVADMDFSKIKEEYGQVLVFHGGISLQGPLRFGTPEQVRKEVKERMEQLGSGGGYVPCTAHNVQADAPLENVVALFEAFRECAVVRD
ncbi:MAG: uroporphyrinogen decarboxylase family protein [Promethearchaeota archaeon]